MKIPSAEKLLVVSQLPPPVHGSTIMTRVFLATMKEALIDVDLVDRRFSRSIADVGRQDVRKIAAIPSLLLRAMKQSRGQKRCVYFTTTNRSSALIDAIMISILRLRGIHIVNYVHTVGYSDLAKTWLGQLISRITFANSDSIVCLSPSLMSDVLPWSQNRPIYAIQNICEPPPAVTDAGIASQAATTRPYVLFLSNLLATKGPRDFLDVAFRLAPRHPNVRFVIAGAAPSTETVPELTKYAEQLGLQSRVEFRGPVYDTAKWKLLREAKLLLFPSTYPREAQPLTLVEAIAVGLPVVAYSVGGIQDLLNSSPIGHVVRAGDLTEMTEQAHAILDDDNAVRTEDYSSMRKTFMKAWREVLDALPDN